MRKLVLVLSFAISFSAIAEEFKMLCMGAKVVRNGNFSYDVERELFTKEIDLSEETSALILTNGEEALVFSGSKGFEELATLSRSLTGMTSFVIGRNYDDADQPTSEMAVFTGKVIGDTVRDLENDIKNTSINLFQNGELMTVDLEKELMLYCKKI